MRPAFDSTRQAGFFALLLLTILILPATLGPFCLPSREQTYSQLWSQMGGYQFIQQEIFHEKSDLDILFIGSSRITYGIDTPYVQEELSKRLGRPAKVRTFGWGGSGSDHIYFVAKDLLEHRKVKVIVIDGDHPPYNTPQSFASHWFRIDDWSNLEGLSWQSKAIYYFASVMGTPRNLAALISPYLPADAKSRPKIPWAGADSIERLGSIAKFLGFSPDYFHEHEPFIEFQPPLQNQASFCQAYTPQTKASFDFSGANIPPLQLTFFRKLAQLSQQHDCKLVVIHIPIFDERHSSVISNPVFWPDTLHADTTMVGIPPSVLFQNLSEEDIRKLFGDPFHFNKNGQEFFTSIVTPILLDIYEAKAQH
jgi:hypothetical protein